MSSQGNSSTGLSHPEYDTLFAGHDARVDFAQEWLGEGSGLNQAVLPSPAAVSASPARSSTSSSSSASVVRDEPHVDDQQFPRLSDFSASTSDVNNEGISLIRGAILEIRGPSTSASDGLSAANNNGGEGSESSMIRARGAVVQISQSTSGYGSGDGRLRERATRATVAQVAGGSPHRTPRRAVARVPQRLASQHRNSDTPQYYEIWRDPAVLTTFLNSREYSFTYSLCFFFLE
jgi:hypothetical protein